MRQLEWLEPETYGTPVKQYMGRKRKEMHEERLNGKNNFNILSK